MAVSLPPMEEFGYFPQRKLKMRVFDLNKMAGETLPYAHIYPIGDSHEGDIYSREDAVQAAVNFIKNDPYGFIILLGDLVDAPNRHSVGNVHHQKKSPQQAKFDMIDRLMPVAHKIIAAVGGNHDQGRPSKEAGGDFAEDIAHELQTWYEPEFAAMRLKVGKYNSGGALQYDVAVTHGTGGGRTIGGKANMIRRMADIVAADLYICGHTHQELTYPQPLFVPVEGREHRGKDGETWINADLVPRKFLIAGPLRDWGGYAARGLMAPNLVGTPWAKLHGRKKWVEVRS